MSSTEQDFEDILSNPVYIGIGPYPQIVDEDKWLEAAKVRAENDGVEHAIEQSLKMLRRTRYLPDIGQPETYIETANEDGIESAFKQLIETAKEHSPETTPK
jgi:hypothetical protein